MIPCSLWCMQFLLLCVWENFYLKVYCRKWHDHVREEQKDGDCLFRFIESMAYTICIQNISMIYQNWNGFPFIISMEQRTLECISKFKMYRISSTLSSVYSIVCGINCIHSKYSYEIPKPWWITIALSMEHRTEMYFLTFELKFPSTIRKQYFWGFNTKGRLHKHPPQTKSIENQKCGMA